MRPEITAILCCARTHVDDESAARVEALLEEDLDWRYLLTAALSHRVAPLLYRSLQATCPEAVPPSVLDQLREHFRDNARRNLVLTQELLRLLEALQNKGVPVIPLKGPVLAQLVYGNVALREFYDLDLLVCQRDARKAYELVASQGYQPRHQPTQSRRGAFPRTHREIQLVRADGTLNLDVQWRIPADWLPRFTFPIDTKRLLGRTELVSMAGVSFPILVPEDLLLMLCVHGASHGWRRLQLICDVAELLRAHPEMDLGRVAVQARAVGIERMLLLGLFLASDLLGIALPVEVARDIEADEAIRSPASQVSQWMFGDSHGPADLFEEAAFYIGLRERLRDRVHYALIYLWEYLRPALVPSEADRDRVYLPVALSWMYYVIRLVRMLAVHGLSPLKRGLQRLLRQVWTS